MNELLGGLVGIWILLFGMAVLLQQHKWFWSATKRLFWSTIRWLYLQLKALIRWLTTPLRTLARAYRTQIILFFVGFIGFFVVVGMLSR